MKKKKQQSHLPLRLNVIFFVIFLLFSLLILQLGVVQILYGEDAQKEIERTENVTSKTSAPRGKMYDRNGELVVDNISMFAITYTPKRNVQPQENLDLARKLVHYMDMNTSSVTERDMKDYLIMKNRNEYYGRLSDEEKQELNNTEQYQAVLNKITEKDLAQIDEDELEVIAIKRELDQAYELTPYVIKNSDISKEEYAVIAENLHELPGINVTVDWDRDKLVDNSFYAFVGNVSNAKQGIPREEMQYYLSRNYNRNDRVGTSGLEEQYELLLKGHKEVRQHITDSSGKVISSEVVRQGQRGKDLKLTVDLEYQSIVDQILREELETAINKFPYENRFMKDAMAVVMDPNTGEILAISGQSYNRKEEKFENTALKTIYDAHLPGSAVKGATVLSGFQSGVISIGERINDRTLHVGGQIKGSYRDLGPVNDLDALRRSSNVYMFFIALRMGGEYNYYKDIRPYYDRQGFYNMRNYFKQFGLGVETGIDFPYESTGVRGEGDLPGFLMDFAIGQYETYTTLQLAQYVSTIANGGYRMQPYLVKQIHEPTNTDHLGPIYDVNEPTVLNRIDMPEHFIKRVQEGFRQAYQERGGTAVGVFGDKVSTYNPAGKTGTAEERVKGEDGKYYDVYNLTLVGYAPFDNPEVAFAVIVPYTGDVTGQYNINLYIGERILDEYFKLKEKRLHGTSSPTEEVEDENNDEDESTNE
ncbi:peptidoglycan D,D-transpeptidase FtsI family protein [Bacillaceae bacterium W0354]